jgi:hypothetical protein
MAKARSGERKGRRVIPVARRRVARNKKSITLGEVVAAVFDAVGGDAERAARLLNSRELARALGRRIVVA